MIARAARSAALWTCLVWMPVRILLGGGVWPDALVFCAGWLVGSVVWSVIRRWRSVRRGIKVETADELRQVAAELRPAIGDAEADELLRMADEWDELDEGRRN